MFPYTTYVFVHGTYDVGLANAGILGEIMWQWDWCSYFWLGIIMVINQRVFISGFKGLLHRSPNMDTLVALVLQLLICAVFMRCLR